MSSLHLAPAAEAFDAVADRFDERFGGWLSVAAQRRAVRTQLLRAFAEGSRILEVGGGTGDDAEWLTRRGRTVQVTDASPAMVRIASRKLAGTAAPLPRIVAAENIGSLAPALGMFEGAFSNFAALNCVQDLGTTARGLASLVKPDGRALLVMFGTCCVGEWLVETLRGNPRAAARRFSRREMPARLGGRHFTVKYHTADDVAQAFAPWFKLTGRRGIGIMVPPSAAEPWISKHPGLVRTLERCDQVLARPFASLGDHVLYDLTRTAAAA